MATERTAYKLPLFPCGSCGREIKPPYVEVLFDRHANLYFTANCGKCKHNTQWRYNILELIRISEDCDGFKPTRH